MKGGRAESLSHPPTSAELPLGCCVQAPLVGRSVGRLVCRSLVALEKLLNDVTEEDETFSLGKSS